ncbi:MAG: hypothetical protein II603_09395, partial [Muribaculaceae bacterium]|nr:hypothetical protein [Muribaculaceae bacterium]
IFVQLNFLAIFSNRTTFHSNPENLSKSQGVKTVPKTTLKRMIFYLFTHPIIPYCRAAPSNQKITQK